MKWLTWALCVSGFGALGELSVAALTGASIAGRIWYMDLLVLWIVALCSPICLMIGIALGVVGLRMLDKK